ncbi:hypothetical protein HanRHA438_Chr03g0121711 [Helianthus annuus]|nr:hypothetical protein HanRHA438_Chr03g0121711 [Helianthus annuus]
MWSKWQFSHQNFKHTPPMVKHINSSQSDDVGMSKSRSRSRISPKLCIDTELCRYGIGMVSISGTKKIRYSIFKISTR